MAAMLCTPTEAAEHLNYKSPASLYRLIRDGLLEDYIEVVEGVLHLEMGGSRSRPTLAKRVRSLVNFKGDHEMFMFDPKEEASLQRVRDLFDQKRAKKLSTSVNS
tara:strand:- start:1782 stop:2096 length:315 start_codon:yes stop_codon:yes gene_type:complete